MTQENKGSMEFTNKHNLPQPIVTLLSRHKYSRGKADISVSELISPPQLAVLKREHGHKIVEDVSERFWALMGTNIHKILEDHANETVRTEERLFTDVEGWVVSGAIDLQQDGDGHVSITDWKFTSVYSVMHPKPEWENQLNLYAALIRRARLCDVSHASVVAILRDWTKSGLSRKSGGYPVAPIVTVGIPLWSADRQERYLQERVKAHQMAAGSHDLDGTLPECTDEERWIRKKGVPTRCKDYCVVAPYCAQWNKNPSITEEGS